jgi:hypothetical protein
MTHASLGCYGLLTRVSVMKRWDRVRTALRHYLPDDRLFVALLTTWVAVLAVVTYLLLGWASAGVLIAIAGIVGTATVAFHSSAPYRQNHGGARSPGRNADFRG